MSEKKEIDELIIDVADGYSSYMSSLLSLINKLQSEIEQLKFDISVIKSNYCLPEKPGSLGVRYESNRKA